MSACLSDRDPHSEAERSPVAQGCDRIPATIGAAPSPDSHPGEIGQNTPEFPGAPRRPCPVCGAPLTGAKTSACSDRCRAAKSRRRRADALTERDRLVRELLEAAVRALVRADEPRT